MKIRNFDMFGVRAYVCMAPAALLGEDFAADSNGQGMAALKINDAAAFNRKLVRVRGQKLYGSWHLQVGEDGLYISKCEEGKTNTPLRFSMWYDMSDLVVTAMKMEGIISFAPVHNAVRAFLENGRIKRLKQLGRKLSREGAGSSV